MIEIWKPIPGFEEFYKVSNYGRIKSNGGRRGSYLDERLLKPKINRDGYIHFRVNKGGGIQKLISAHRTVAIVFIPNPKNKTEVNHIDFDKSNNDVRNLEWVTPKENIAHSIAHGIHKSFPSRAKQSKLKNIKFTPGMTATIEGKREYMRQYNAINYARKKSE